MKYEFSCSECEEVVTLNMNPSDFREVKDSGLSRDSLNDYDHSLDCGCDDDLEYNFNPDGLEVCWRGFEWADKNYKEKKYRKNRSKKLAKKQKEEHHVPELKPNYKGQRTESWREAKEEAKKDAHPRLETTYDEKIEEEDG
jgi:hypothetical protein